MAIKANNYGTQGWDEVENLIFPDYISISHNCTNYDVNAKYNVCVFIEPPSVLNLPARMFEKFDLVLTWRKDLLDALPNAKKFLFGTTWIEHDKLIFDKKDKISFLTSWKEWAPGHSLRQQVFDLLSNHSKIHNFDLTCIKTPPRIESKNEILDEYKFSIIIENENLEDWFTEKIVDCFATKTVPIYWGCPNIGDYFDEKGIIKFNNINDLIIKLADLETSTYEDMLTAVEKNYKAAPKYYSYWKRIYKEINLHFYGDKDANI
ncbi:hypothetical protein EBU94_01995 [bacterium]|nr:hypothetical protein [bacterium]